MTYKRFTWKTEKLQYLDDEVIMIVDNENKDWKGHILNIVDLLNNLHQENQELQEKIMKVKQSNNHYYTEYYRIKEENEQLRQELQGMNELLKSYRKTIKHDAELLADATRNGYLPPLDDFVKR